MDWMMGPEKKSSLDLYVRRVLIMHECEQLAPTYLRFVRGVVDSCDLPLNVSRETIQNNPILSKIRTSVVGRVLKTLEEMKNEEYEKSYLPFYKEFGSLLKEGVGQDYSNRDRLADLLLFESTKTDAKDETKRYTTLAKYIDAMPAEQKEIYFLVGDSRELVENSPVSGGVQGARAGGAAADRPDRRIPRRVAARVQGKEPQGRRPRRRRRGRRAGGRGAEETVPAAAGDA
jgi:HSP90 family molecular chaperone